MIAVMEALSGAADTASVTARATEAVRAALGCSYAVYWPVSFIDGQLRPGYESGDLGTGLAARTRQAALRKGVGFPGRAWQADDVILTTDPADLDDPDRASAARDAGVRAALCVPVKAGERFAGVIECFSAASLEPSPGLLTALRAVGELVSQAAEWWSTMTAARAEVAEASAVIGALEQVITARPKERMLRGALDAVREAFGWTFGVFWQVDAADAALRAVLASGVADPEFQRLTFDIEFAQGAGLPGEAWRAGDVVFAPDLAQLGESVRAPAALACGIASGVCFPLTENGSVVGAMEFFSDHSRCLHPNRKATLRRVSQMISQVLGKLDSIEAAEAAAARLTTTIREISNQVRDAAQTTRWVVQHVTRAHEAVTGLGRSSRAIGGIVDAIALIAEQTNALALNASIEASRVASGGKGFGVVADEVRDLAQQAAVATDDVGRHVMAIRSDTATAASSIGTLAEVVQELDDINREIAGILDRQDAITSEFLARTHSPA